MTLREKIETMQAFERGEKIERAHTGASNWQYAYEPTWNWVEYCYRIKPKPKQTVVIEKWLLSLDGTFCVLEGTPEHHNYHNIPKVKLLDTYEVTL